MSAEAPAIPAPTPAAVNTGTDPQGDVKHQELVELNQQAINGYIEQGRLKGIREGRELELARASAIAAVCPGKPDMAVAAILAGQTPESATLAFNAAAFAEARAKEEAYAKDKEIARWQALAATGGYPNGVSFTPTQEAEDTDGRPLTKDEAEAQAKNEWDKNPKVRKGFSTKERYIAYRKNELMGNVTRQVAGASA